MKLLEGADETCVKLPESEDGTRMKNLTAQKETLVLWSRDQC